MYELWSQSDDEKLHITDWRRWRLETEINLWTRLRMSMNSQRPLSKEQFKTLHASWHLVTKSEGMFINNTMSCRHSPIATWGRGGPITSQKNRANIHSSAFHTRDVLCISWSNALLIIAILRALCVDYARINPRLDRVTTNFYHDCYRQT